MQQAGNTPEVVRSLPVTPVPCSSCGEAATAALLDRLKQ